MSKSQSRIFSRLQYFSYIVYVRKVTRCKNLEKLTELSSLKRNKNLTFNAKLFGILNFFICNTFENEFSRSYNVYCNHRLLYIELDNCRIILHTQAYTSNTTEVNFAF